MKREHIFIHPRWQLGGVEQTNSRWISLLIGENFPVKVLTHDASAIIARCPQQNFRNFFQLWWHAFFIGNDKVVILTQSYLIFKFWPHVLFWRLFSRNVIVIAERNSVASHKSNGFSYIFKLLFLFIFSFFVTRIIVNSREISAEFPYSFFALKRKVCYVGNPRFDELDVDRLFKRRETLLVSKKIRMFMRWDKQKNTEFVEKVADGILARGWEFEVFCGANDFDYQKPFTSSVLSLMIVEPTVIMFCSNFEGLPNVLIEARAAGLPVLFSYCPTGVRQIMDNYDNGFEFKSNSVESFFDVLDSLSDELRTSPIDKTFIYEYSTFNKRLLDVLR